MKLARLTATLLTVAALTACSEDPEPKVEPSEGAPTPTGQTSPTSGPPETLGPEETVRAWVDARNILMLKGDAAAVEALSAPNCRTCRLSVEPLKEVHRKGGRFETSGWWIASSRIRSQSPKSTVVGIGLVIPGGRTIPEAGANPVKYEEQKRIILVTVIPSGVEWLVSKLVYLL